MAKLTFSLNTTLMLSKDSASGEMCKVCELPIYGDCFRLTVSYSVKDRIDLPKFNDTKIYVCNSCKEAIKDDLREKGVIISD